MCIYEKALSLYDQAIAGVKRIYGQSNDYFTLEANRQEIIKQLNRHHLKGLDLCQRYYETYGQKMIEEKTFRKDLYYHLREGLIYLPPLNRRKKDIPQLLDYWEEKGDLGKKAITEPVLEAFQKYPNDVRSVFIVPQYTEAKDKDGKLIEELYFISENFFYNNDKTPAEDPLHRHYYRFQQVKNTSSGYQIVTDEKKDFFEYDSPNVLERPDGSLYVRARQVYRENGE